MKTLKTYKQLFENNELSDDEILSRIIEPLYISSETFMSLARQLKDINHQNKSGNSTLLWAIYKFDLPVVKEIVELGADVNLGNKHGDYPLNWAFDDNTLETIDYLTKQGADWNLKTNQKSQSPNMNFKEYCNNVKYRLNNWEDEEYKEKLKVINDPEYPKLMNEYLMGLDMDKFNI